MRFVNNFGRTLVIRDLSTVFGVQSPMWCCCSSLLCCTYLCVF